MKSTRSLLFLGLIVSSITVALAGPGSQYWQNRQNRMSAPAKKEKPAEAPSASPVCDCCVRCNKA